MKNIKGYILKVILLIAIIIACNYIYKYFFFESDLQQHSDMINIVREAVKENNAIIYLGESSNVSYRDDDMDKRSISGFVADYFPEKQTGDITQKAAHAEIYYELLKNIPKDDRSIETVIVTLNLRSFDADWIYSKLETSLQKSLVLLRTKYPPLFNRFLLSFEGYDVKTDKERDEQIIHAWTESTLKFPYDFPYKNVIEWRNAIQEQGIYNEDGTKNDALSHLARTYVDIYGFQIDTLKNPRIKDFDNIVTLAQQRNWNLIFNLMAENVEKAETLVGQDLVFLMRQNRDLLIERYQNKGIIVVDNLEKIEDEQFIDQDWTTEHYAEKGRRRIAKNVAEALKTFYPEYYKEVVLTNEKSYSFFNDCEKNNTWGQAHTLNTEKAFSKSRSSKTGGDQMFGLTFEYAIKNLPNSLSTVTVEMYVFQTDNNHDAKLAFELSGEKIKSTWNGVELTNLTQEVNNWVKIEHTFTLNETFADGDIVKIYLYNPTTTIIYIDDISIVFE